MLFNNRNYSSYVLHSSTCRSLARCLNYIILHLHHLQSISTTIRQTGKMEALWGYKIARSHQQWRPSQDPYSGKSPHWLHIASTPHPQVAVPTAAQGFLQVCLRPSASPEASLCFQCIRSLHRLSPWGTLGRLMPSAPEGVPANAIPSSRLASTVPRPMGMAPAWWCHWMVLSGSIRPELLSAAHLHWGWGKTEGSSGLLSQLAAGAADAQHIPLLWEVYRHRGWMRQILHPGWFSIFISLTIRQGLCIKSTLWSTTDLKLSEEDGKTEKWVLSNLTEVESEGKYPILVIKSSSC